VGYFISTTFSGGLTRRIGEPLPEMQYEQPRWTMSSHSSQTHGYIILHFRSLCSLSTSLRVQSYCSRTFARRVTAAEVQGGSPGQSCHGRRPSSFSLLQFQELIRRSGSVLHSSFIRSQPLSSCLVYISRD
jgi:hypothetical protein